MIRILYLLLVLCMVGCASTKKAMRTEVMNISEKVETAVTHTKTEKLQDTAITSEGRIVVTEVEFLHTDSTSPTLEHLAVSGGTFTISGIKGNPIKSIRQTTYEQKQERKSLHKESQESIVQNKQAALHKQAENRTKQTARVLTPFWLKCALYGVIVGLVWILYLKRLTFVKWIRQLLTGL